MATREDLHKLAMALPGTCEAPHMDRTAYRVDRIYVTVAAEEQTANFKFTPDEQMFKCEIAPEVFSAIPNGWGRQGWTTATLAAASVEDLGVALLLAHSHAVGKPKKR